jgi:drug/metabolite transporter (DMT)-like permease
MKNGARLPNVPAVASESIFIGLAVLAWLLWRQLQVRELRHDRGYGLPLVLCVAGVAQIVQYDHEHPLAGAGIALLAVSIVVAAAFAIWRATTVRVWLDDGRLLRRGTAVTIVLWLVAIAIHLGGDHLIAPHDAERLGSVSLLLYLGVSLGVQRFALGERARRLLTARAWPDDAARGA